MKPDDANAVEQHLGPPERVAVHATWCRTIALMLTARRLDVERCLAERIRATLSVNACGGGAAWIDASVSSLVANNAVTDGALPRDLHLLRFCHRNALSVMVRPFDCSLSTGTAITGGHKMRSACPSKCENGRQRPLEPSEMSRLSAHARSALVLLKKQGSICNACGLVYVSCPSGTIYLEKISLLPHVNVPYSPRPIAPRMRFSR